MQINIICTSLKPARGLTNNLLPKNYLKVICVRFNHEQSLGTAERLRRQTLQALVHEYLFASLFRACAESLASENASRLAAMQRAEKNIDELREELSQTFHRLRQNTIDEELFEVISGFEAMVGKHK